ncbi:protein-disulfide reductase DsbD family protein [Phenylobacterium sp.]|uniref:protein-disulfide reductase DsbD family protein n=1 Tax=Phenylobacterium sp. TaxID=1871053 RepID=UPI002DE74CEE|nr:thioredoxin family protein [Phenylobacterium sp.]
MRWLAAILAFLAVSTAAAAAPINTGHLSAELVSQTQGIAPGQTAYIALHQKIQPGWHTYWRNAGDSGEPTRLKWTLPSGWKAGDIVWPTPRRLPVGPLVNYGYEDDVVLPVAITAPADAKPGQAITLKAAASFLVCKDICVPEDATLQIALPVVAGPAATDPQWGQKIAATLAATPKPAGLTAVFQKKGAMVALAIVGAPLKGAEVHDVYFYPFDSTVIDHAKPQRVERGPDGLTLTLTPGYAFQGAAAPAAMGGVLALDGKAYEVAATSGPPPAGAAGLGPPAPKGAAGGAGLGLITAAVFAFVGGLILNLMPCVFPILAMKAASLAAHGGGAQAGEARRHGLAFGAGALITFLALAGLLIGLKAAGAAIGWGFQLQSPPVVAVLALLMLAVALDLSGVFEVGTSLQGLGSGAASRGGLVGDLFTGALAVVVAAPCTAPFMGASVGWALTQPAAAALTVFLALGIGFAMPFVAATFWPGLLARLPKPGPWMDAFRKALAFPMYGAAAWLAWVLTIQAGETALARIFIAAIVLALAAWLAGAAQRSAARGQRPVALVSFAALLGAAALAGVIWPAYAETSGDSAGAKSADAAWEAYSPERLADLRAQGRPVFVNYTAAWCVSCQVNDRVVISTRSVAEAMKADKVVYLKADWTKRDPVIAAELARYGRAGVPLYLVYGANGGEPQVLPAILTRGVVLRALEAAAKG